MEKKDKKSRCGWVNETPLYISYHDFEWGVPVHDDIKLFEMLVLEGLQAGLSWYTVLKKREAYRQAFYQFNPQKMAEKLSQDMPNLLQNSALIRNKLKMQAAVTNARAYLELINKEGSFAKYIWQFVGGAPIINHWDNLKAIPTNTEASDCMSKALKQRGFKFVGTTICYAYMQAVGMVMDHTKACFRYHELSG